MTRRTRLKQQASLKRGRWRKPGLHAGVAGRPGVTGPLPRRWDALCAAIRMRDGFQCRRCGWEALTDGRGQVDHCLPRRIGGTDDPANLTTLCRRCHAWKSHALEPALYRGDVLAFKRYLRQIGDPQPSPEQVGAALGRLKELLEKGGRPG